MNNQFWGSTIEQLGGTYLNTKAIISVEEGYNIGGSLHLVNLGDYEVEGFDNSGLFNQQLQLDLHSPIERLKYNNSYFQRELTNHPFYYTSFVSEDSFNTDWTISNSGGDFGVTSASLKLRHTSGSISQAYLNDTKDFSNFRVILRLGSSSFDNATQNPRGGIQFHADFSVQDEGWLWRISGEPTNALEVFRLGQLGTGTTRLFSTAFNPAQNADYWLMAVVRDSSIYFYSSTNGRAYTLQYSSSTLGDFYNSRQVGIRMQGASGTLAEFKEFDFVGIGNINTTEDTLRTILGMGGIFGVSFQNEFSGFTPFMANNGGTWYLGTSNNLYFVGLSSGGNSWYTFMTSGGTYSDFVAEVDFKGCSGHFTGMIVGETNNFYGNQHLLSPSTSNGLDHYLDARFLYEKRGDYLGIKEQTWYKMRMVKSGLFIGWYINDLLANSIYGTSLSDTDNNHIGFFVYRGVPAGVTIEFRNFRIGRLDQLADDTTIEANQSLASIYNRYLPDGFASVWHEDHVEIFEAGSSRDVINIGDSFNIINSEHSISNIAGDKLVTVKGQKDAARVENANNRVRLQLDSSRSSFLNEQGIQNRTDATSYGEADIFISNRNVDSVSVELNPRVHLEQYDEINYVDSTLGISRKMNLYSNNKVFDAGTGEFRQTLTLF